MKRIFLILSTVGLLSSCGAIVNGSHQDVFIGSNVSGAQVKIDGQIAGQTPFKTELRRDEKHIVEASAKGYKTKMVTVDNGLSPWIAGNLFCGGIIGLVVDFINGGAWELDTEDVTNIQMEKQ